MKKLYYLFMNKLKIQLIVLVVALSTFQGNLLAVENVQHHSIIDQLKKTELIETEINLLNYLYLSKSNNKFDPSEMENFLTEYGTDYNQQNLFQVLFYMLSADRNYFEIISGADMRIVADTWKYNSNEFKSFLSFRFYKGTFEKLNLNGKVFNYVHSLGYDYEDVEFAIVNASILTLINFEDVYNKLLNRGYSKDQVMEFFTYHSKHDFTTDKLLNLFDLLESNGFNKNKSFDFILNLFSRNLKIKALKIDKYIETYSEILASNLLLNFPADEYVLKDILKTLYYFKSEPETEKVILNSYIDFFGEEYGKSIFNSIIESSLKARARDTSLIENLVEETKSFSKTFELSKYESAKVLSKTYSFYSSIDSRPILENQVISLINTIGFDNTMEFMNVIYMHLMRSSDPGALLDISISTFKNLDNIKEEFDNILFILDGLDPPSTRDSLPIALKFLDSEYNKLINHYSLEEIKKYFFGKNEKFNINNLKAYNNLFISIKNSNVFSDREKSNIINLLKNSNRFKKDDTTYLEQILNIYNLDLSTIERDKFVNVYLTIYPEHSLGSIKNIIKIYRSTDLSFLKFIEYFFISDIHRNSPSNPKYWNVLYMYSQYLNDFTRFSKDEKTDILLKFSSSDNSSISWNASKITQHFKKTLNLSQKDRMKLIISNPVLNINKLLIDGQVDIQSKKIVGNIASKHNLSKSKTKDLSNIINNPQYTLLNGIDINRIEFSDDALTIEKSIELTKKSSVTKSNFSKGIFVTPKYYEAFKEISKLNGSKLDKEIISFNIELINSLENITKTSSVINYLEYLKFYYSSKEYDRNILIDELLYLLDIYYNITWSQYNIDKTNEFITQHIEDAHLGLLLELFSYNSKIDKISNLINYIGNSENAMKIVNVSNSFSEYEKDMRDILYLYYALTILENLSKEEALILLSNRTRIDDYNDDNYTNNLKQYYLIKNIQRDKNITFTDAYKIFFQ